MFANPFAVVALSLLALPIIIHMLARLKGRRVLFPTTKYLRQSESHRLRPMKIERRSLLIIRLLAFALLIFAISDPASNREAGRSRAVLLLIDSSLSMKTEGAKQQALARAREAVASLSAGDIAAVAQFDSSVNLLCDFTADRNSLEAGIASYSQHSGPADFSAALAWGNKLLATRPHSKQLVLISDLQSANLYSSKRVRLSGVDLKIIRVEMTHRINATPGMIAARAAGDSIKVESTALRGEGDRTTVAPVSFDIEPRDTETVATARGSNAILAAKIYDADVLAGAVTATEPDEFDPDDSRFFVARLSVEERILIVRSRLALSDQAAFIAKAIAASSQAKTAARRAEINDSLPESAAAFARYTAVITPIDALARGSLPAASEYLRHGGSLIITAGAAAAAPAVAERLNELGAALSQVSFNKVYESESLGLMLPVLSFTPARFRAAYLIHADEGETLLRYSNDQPAAVRVSVGAGHVLILGFGLSDEDSSLARGPVFPDLIEWLISSVSSNGRTRQFTMGQTPVAGLLRGLTRLTRLYSASGPVREELAADGSALAQPGVYEAQYESEKILFAVNSPTAESMLAQSTDLDLLNRIELDEASPKSAIALQREDGNGLWRVLAIGALALSLIELCLFELSLIKFGWPVKQ
jgi:hypothetical protein